MPDTPQQTTATFGDWTLRCDRSGTSQACELVQAVTNQGRTLAQIALGRTARGQPMHLTILVPPSVAIGQPPLFQTAADKPAALAELVWRRCLPGGCLAEASVNDALLQRLRARTGPAQIVFLDAANHGVTLPFSPRGLGPAIDALSKEESS